MARATGEGWRPRTPGSPRPEKLRAWEGGRGAGSGVTFKETVLGNTGKEFLICYSESITLWPSRTPRILA